MRFTVVVALVVHAVVLAWVAPRTHARVVTPPAPLPAPAEPVVDVVLLDEPSVASKQPARAHIGDVARPHTHRARIGDAAPAAVHDYLAMRDDGRAQRGDHVDLAIHDPPPTHDDAGRAPVAAAHDSELRPAGHGTYTTDLGGSSWRTRTATAHVARDGTVTFENAPDFDLHYAGIALVGKFNPDDWLERKAGIDPYASAKLEYLDRTRDERARIAEVHRAEDLAQPRRAMQRNLDAARAIADPIARKQALFELWDDVAETGDEALVRAGTEARACVVEAIRAMRPALAFTPDELATLNARRHSRAVFAPYD